MSDRFAATRAVADAVLYEGYVLYPYRASAQKNQVRWQFGVLVPPQCQEAGSSERASMQTECIVDPRARVGTFAASARARALPPGASAHARAADRGLGNVRSPRTSSNTDGTRLVPWDEAVEQEIDLPNDRARPERSHRTGLRDPRRERQPSCCRTPTEVVLGRVTRTREEIRGRLAVSVRTADGTPGLLRLAVSVENTTDWSEPDATREAVTRRSIVAAHTMLAIDDGAFVSLLDPTADAIAAVAECNNIGTFPVLVGSPGATDLVLSSPIILYDYPAIAPESQGALYDSTEIDEILALRVLTLTDEEKAEARATDLRAAAIVDRCDAMDPAAFAQLHGTMREYSFGQALSGRPESGESGVPDAPSSRRGRRATVVGSGCRRLR